MSNYHVEPVDRPQALSSEAIKSLRDAPGQGHLAAPAPALLDRRRDGRLAARGHGRHDRLPLAEPVRRVRWQGPDRHARARSSSRTASLPIAEGFPAYVPEARAFIVLIDPGRQQFVARRGHERRRHGAQRPGALPALPAPRLQAEPVPQELLARVPLPRLALRPARDQGRRRPVRARRRGAWTASRRRWTATAS